MAAVEPCEQLPLGSGETRREPRTEIVRMVEYAPFPRVARDADTRIGYTRDETSSGLCLGVDRAEQPGALLRVVVRDVDGRPSLDTVARVVWCLPRDDGRFWVGLALVAESQQRMLPVRHTRRSRRIEVSA